MPLSLFRSALTERRVDATVYKLVLGDVEVNDGGPHHFVIAGHFIESFSLQMPQQFK